jgi:hypothetical protein
MNAKTFLSLHLIERSKVKTPSAFPKPAGQLREFSISTEADHG